MKGFGLYQLGACKPLTIRGQKFRSQTQAAKHFGVSQPTVAYYVRTGQIDKIGLPGNGKGGRPVKPVTIRGVKYPSVKVAAEALGVTPPTVSKAFKDGNPDLIGLVRKPYLDRKKAA